MIDLKHVIYNHKNMAQVALQNLETADSDEHFASLSETVKQEIDWLYSMLYQQVVVPTYSDDYYEKANENWKEIYDKLEDPEVQLDEGDNYDDVIIEDDDDESTDYENIEKDMYDDSSDDDDYINDTDVGGFDDIDKIKFSNSIEDDIAMCGGNDISSIKHYSPDYGMTVDENIYEDSENEQTDSTVSNDENDVDSADIDEETNDTKEDDEEDTMDEDEGLVDDDEPPEWKGNL